MIGTLVQIALKDLRIEMRNREVVALVLPFAGSLLISFGLAFGPGTGSLQSVEPALLWLATLFAAVLAIRASLEIESADDAFEELLLSPADRAGIYLGKVVALSAELIILGGVTVGIGYLLFGLPPSEAELLSFPLGVIAIAAIGTLFGVLAMRSRASESLLPLLVFPTVIPVLLGGIQASELGALGRPAQAFAWIRLLAALAVAAVALGTVVFEHLIDG